MSQKLTSYKGNPVFKSSRNQVKFIRRKTANRDKQRTGTNNETDKQQKQTNHKNRQTTKTDNPQRQRTELNEDNLDQLC